MNPISNDVSSSAIYVVISSIVGLALTGMSLNFLGPDLYGLWVLILTILILGMFGEHGLGLPIIRLINIDDIQYNQEVLTTCIGPIILINCIIFLALFFVNPLFIDYLSSSNFEISYNKELILPLMGIIVFLFLFSIIPTSCLIGYNQLYVVNYIKTLSRLLQMGVAFWLFNNGLNLWSLILSLLLYQISVLFFTVIFTLRVFQLKIYYKQFFNKNIYSDLVRVGYKIVAARIVGLGIDPLFKYSLGFFLGFKYVAFFDIAFKLNSLVTQIPLVALKGRISTFTGILRESRYSLINGEMRKIDLHIALYVVPIFILALFFAEYFLILWLQDGYDYRMKLGLLFLMPTLSVYIFANARELFLVSAGDSATTLGAYITNALVLATILFGTYILPVKPTFFSLMASYCFAHICGAVFIYRRYFYFRSSAKAQ